MNIIYCILAVRNNFTMIKKYYNLIGGPERAKRVKSLRNLQLGFLMPATELI